MPDLPRVGDLEIDQDLDFQRREWAFQRVMWVVMGLVGLAALLGLFGGGLFSGASAATPDGTVRVEYERFLRFHAPATLTVHLSGAAVAADEARVEVGRAFLEGVEVHAVTPAPERVEAGPDAHVFVFRLARRGRPTAVVLHLEPGRVGLLEGRVGLAGGEGVDFRPFVYP